MGKRKPDADAYQLAAERLQEQAGELTDTAVRAWAAQAGMTVDEWSRHWQPVVELETRPPHGLRTDPSRFVITVRADVRKGAPDHGSQEEP